MTMATETENNAPAGETKDIKDVKDMKEALKDETSDNKQQQEDTKDAAPAKEEKKDEANAETPAPAPAKTVTVHKPNFEKDIVYLYQFQRTPLLPSLSPYCLKVETWLRINGIKYENVDHKLKFRSKKGQLPFVELNGEEIADSAIILRELGQKYGKDLDAGLTPEQRNISHAMISMIENHLVWVVWWWRTKNPDLLLKGFKVNLQHAFGTRIPNAILNFFFKFTFSRKCARKVKAQGMGVHTAEEVAQFGCDDLKVLCDMLADKPFFFGDEPTTLDVVAFSNLAQILYIEKDTPYALRDYMQESCANLVGHCSRMKERCFPDWDDICSTLDLNTHLPKPVKQEEKESKEEAKETKESKEEKEGDKEKADKEEKDVEKDKEVEENKDKEKDGK
ncbi:failed axon connections [Neodiprion pinetum]|uniref:Failed axon connections n=1 Tax=Neodiprion lecontei TaxID=441921 RepID=A0A6J0BH85_NEOLC|nr:failed axon connections [Neodiprion lecontei]XP_046433176.1 failed axon connections [Neodiprion fabricii]XP_046492393.1 failed axon connections [Neodiprion pinetum]XP_046627032.1 failed axon connections [Neodiprion virginianus]